MCCCVFNTTKKSREFRGKWCRMGWQDAALKSARATPTANSRRHYYPHKPQYITMYIRDLRSFEIRFEFESAVPIRFDSTVMGRFENFRIGHVCPLLVVVRRLKPLMALSGTVYRLASSMSDHTPVLFNVFEPLSMLLTGITICA